MIGVVPVLLVISLIGGVSAFLCRRFRPNVSSHTRAAGVARIVVIATTVQAVHFVEELLSGFNYRFPALFGLPPLPLAVFVTLNVALLVLWAGAARGILSAHSTAYPAAWFLAVAGVANAIGHPILSAVVGGYFPGVVTAPLVGGTGIWLLRQLYRASQAPVHAEKETG